MFNHWPSGTAGRTQRFSDKPHPATNLGSSLDSVKLAGAYDIVAEALKSEVSNVISIPTSLAELIRLVGVAGDGLSAILSEG